MKDWYSDTYINLVTETFFGKNVFLSEKIFKPLSNLQAFIVLGDYGTIAELKRLGFKTFEPFIDESYDLEIDSKIRIKKIEKEIEKLKNKVMELKIENDSLRIQLHKLNEIKTQIYEYKIIDELNTLMTNTKGTIQHNLIQDRLEAFYLMNKNIKL